MTITRSRSVKDLETFREIDRITVEVKEGVQKVGRESFSK